MEPSQRSAFIEHVRQLLGGIPDGEAIVMINLLRYRERAVYDADAGHAPCSGEEAYRRYLAAATPFVLDVGGSVVWQGTPRATVLGPPAERWDLALLVRYPSTAAFLAMVSNPGYQAIAIHRTAALEDSRLIATLPATP